VPADYLPVLVLVVVAVAMSAIAITLSSLLGPRKPSADRWLPYESGMVPAATARLRFPIKFLVVAILFLLFDVAVIFLYPWAVFFRHLQLLGLIQVGIFLGILSVGYYYVWRKGALEWD
jgi:NADH-quinone oxidoreductase subunit A